MSSNESQASPPSEDPKDVALALLLGWEPSNLIRRYTYRRPKTINDESSLRHYPSIVTSIEYTYAVNAREALAYDTK